MKNKKILAILMPVILIVIVLIAGFVFITLNSSPEKIFRASIGHVVNMFEDKEEEYETVKGTMNLSANIESEQEQMQVINNLLDKLNIGINMEADTKNIVVNENINITYDNQNLLNVTAILQDEKAYLYLQDWLDKYLEIPRENLDYSEIAEYQEKAKTIDVNKIIESVGKELTNEIAKQKLMQEKTTINLNGTETKVTASILELKGNEIVTFAKEFVENLKQSETFQNALGAYKQEIMEALSKMTFNTEDFNQDAEFRFTIYTKGLFNQFAGISCQAVDYNNDNEVIGLDLFRHNKEKFELSNYTIYNNQRKNEISLTVENKKESKNKGTTTITIGNDDEKFTIVCNYEKQENITTFEVNTEIENVKFTVFGRYEENDKNIKGNLTLAFDIQENTKINLKCDYDFSYGVQVQKTDVQNSALIEELSEEEQEELTTNIQNSLIYRIIDALNIENLLPARVNDNWTVKTDGYTVQYTVPDNFTASSYSTEDMKMYTDENFNSVYVYIEKDTVDGYMAGLDNEYVLKSNLYNNQQITDVQKYNVNGRDYSYRIIRYNDEYSLHANLYFAYEIGNDYCYVVEVELENGDISMDIIREFLDINL